MSQFFTSGGQSAEASASASVLPMNISGLISFRMDWLDLLAVLETLKSHIQHHSSRASVLWHSAFFMVQLSHPHDYWKNHSSNYTDFCWQNLLLSIGLRRNCSCCCVDNHTLAAEVILHVESHLEYSKFSVSMQIHFLTKRPGHVKFRLNPLIPPC